MHRMPAMSATLLMTLAVGAVVPDVTAGPDVGATAAAVDAPIDQVTVFSDRARVRRLATVGLGAGVSTLRLPDLPGGTMLDTVRVTSSSGRLLRVEALPVERDRFSIAQVEKLLDALDAVNEAIAKLDGTRNAELAEVELLRTVTPAPPVPEAQREGRPALQPDVSSWLGVVDFFSARRNARLAALRILDIDRAKLDEERARLQSEIQRTNLGAFSTRVVQVVVILHSARARSSKLSLEYFVPGATWTPLYDLELAVATNALTMKSAGLVQQASGEDWTDVKLELSTAVPGQGVDLPELLTWTLGEQKELIPEARPARPPPRPPVLPGPAPRPSAAELERQAQLDLLMQRLSAVVGGDVGSPRRPQKAAKERYRGRPSAPPRSRAPSASPMASEPMMEMADEGDGEVSIATTESSGARSGPTYKRRRLALSEPLLTRDRHLTNPNMPARLARGFDYVYPSRTRVTVPSAGDAHRVPLSVRTFAAETEYVATPSLSKTAYLRAKVKNDAGQPILQGPVNLFVGGDFTGLGQLETTGTGGTINLPLGADEDVRLVREIVPATRTEGVFSKDDITTYSVKIEAGNYKRRAIDIEIVDQVPKTRNGKIEVKLGAVSPAASAPPDANGLLRWKLQIPAGKTEVIRFDYTITRPKDWRLQQR